MYKSDLFLKENKRTTNNKKLNEKNMTIVKIFFFLYFVFIIIIMIILKIFKIDQAKLPPTRVKCAHKYVRYYYYFIFKNFYIYKMYTVHHLYARSTFIRTCSQMHAANSIDIFVSVHF